MSERIKTLRQIKGVFSALQFYDYCVLEEKKKRLQRNNSVMLVHLLIYTRNIEEEYGNSKDSLKSESVL